MDPRTASSSPTRCRQGVSARGHLLRAAIVCSALLGGALPATPAAARPNVIAAFGRSTVAGREVLVEVLVAVQRGRSAREAALGALAAQGAEPISGATFSTNGLLWDRLPVVQNYNPAGEPTALGGSGIVDFEAAHATWNGVPTSRGKLRLGDMTTRCPSLVRECPGNQRFDGKNDVAWLALGGCCTLGVTWFGTTIDEADMALNVNFRWANDGVTDFDVETVLLHENGHVLGLDHSSVEGSVMEASYEGVRRTLHPDDAAAIAFLYPCVGPCGDGMLASGEACDDGNCGEGDGCSSTCTREPLCGDTFCDAGESCTCTIDCGAVPANELHACTDGVDNDCDTLGDCSDPDCGADPACLCSPKYAPCLANVDCCSNSCKGKSGRKTCR